MAKSTYLTAQRKGFTKGSANVYTCRICGHRTRPTGTGDNDGVQLCVDCWDLAGEENSYNDTCEFYSGPQEILNTIANIVKKGGNASRWDELKAHAQAALNPQPVAMQKADANVAILTAEQAQALFVAPVVAAPAPAPAPAATNPEYLTAGGKPIGNKTASNLIIARAKAQQATNPGVALVELVATCTDTYISEVKPTDRRTASLLATLKAKGYSW